MLAAIFASSLPGSQRHVLAGLAGPGMELAGMERTGMEFKGMAGMELAGMEPARMELTGMEGVELTKISGEGGVNQWRLAPW